MRVRALVAAVTVAVREFFEDERRREEEDGLALLAARVLALEARADVSGKVSALERDVFRLNAWRAHSHPLNLRKEFQKCDCEHCTRSAEVDDEGDALCGQCRDECV